MKSARPRCENDVPMKGTASKLMALETEIAKSPRVLCTDTSQCRAAKSAVYCPSWADVAVFHEPAGIVMVYLRCAKDTITLGTPPNEAIVCRHLLFVEATDADWGAVI